MPSSYPGSSFKSVFSSADGVTWSVAGTLPGNVLDPSVVIYQNKMWAIGGQSDWGVGTAINNVWNTSDGATWTIVGTPNIQFSYVHQALMVY